MKLLLLSFLAFLPIQTHGMNLDFCDKILTGEHFYMVELKNFPECVNRSRFHTNIANRYFLNH